MKTIVGAVGDDRPLLDRVRSRFDRAFSPATYRFDEPNAYFAVHAPDGRPEDSAFEIDDRVDLCDGPYVPADSDYAEQLSLARAASATSLGPFNAVRWNRTSQSVSVMNDATGLLPFYFSTSRSTLVFSNNFFALANAVEAEADALGELQQVAMGHCLGSRTTSTGIELLPPATELTFSMRGGLERSERQALFSGTIDAQADDLIDDLWDRLVRAVASAPDAYGTPLGLMLSGGLDSRLIAALCAEADVPFLAMTHGVDTMSEVKLARRVAELAGAPHLLVDLDREEYLGTAAEMRRTCFEAGTALFPVWRLAAQRAKALGARAISSGFMLDASLGGHFHDPGNQKERLLRRLRTSRGGASDADAQYLSSQANLDQFVRDYKSSTRHGLEGVRDLLMPDYFDLLESALPAADDAIDHEVSRIREDTTDAAKVIERFMYENRARRFACSQEMVARRYLPIYLPSADPYLVRGLSETPSSMMIDHSLYYRMLRTKAPAFCRIPGSNSPLPLTAPLPALELTRAARNRVDRRLNRLQVRTRGKSAFLLKSGAVNFESVARRPGQLDELHDAIVGSAGVGEPKVSATGVRNRIERIKTWDSRAFNLTALTSLLPLTMNAE